MRKGWRYKVSFVEHPESRNGRLTTFSIADFDKEKETYTNYRCVVFDDIELADRERIVIESITGVELKVKDGKTRCEVVVTIRKAGSEDEAERPRAPAPKPVEDDDDTGLPFDL